MNFVSVEWLFWIATTVSIYWLSPPNWRNRILVALTLGFLVVVDPVSAAILFGLTVITFQLVNIKPLPGWRALFAGIVVAAILVKFKWGADVTATNIVRDVAVPLGLAYYAIRILMYIIDSYVGSVPAHRFEHFVSYLFFLPTIVVGPIHRFHHFLADYQYKRWDSRLLSEGLQRIVYGYAKIVILGNFLISGLFANYIGTLGADELAMRQYLEVIRLGLNLYFQFSGFTDVAIGFSLLLGYRVMENFKWPFLQKNISDFWRCWHISLTSFARDYVHRVILSTSRNQYLAVMGTMMFIALWHELSVRYIVWGLYHGVGIAIWQMNRSYLSPKLPTLKNIWLIRMMDAGKIFFTVNFVMFGFVIVRQPDLASVFEVYKTILLSWI